ncbi:MAG: hypothetical protein H6813_03780 [Phycisphaeraceae bacterium]|nr:hypothetical protein [Phycisphaeraceae bacterium]MCB9847067.1 hypothetical protein [Phycisphaeraceae bacterium]
MSWMLAYTPMLDPMPLRHGTWWLTLLPLALGISIVYKAIKIDDMRRYPKQVAMMTTQIVVVMIMLAIGIQIVVGWVEPLLSS